MKKNQHQKAHAFWQKQETSAAEQTTASSDTTSTIDGSAADTNPTKQSKEEAAKILKQVTQAIKKTLSSKYDTLLMQLQDDAKELGYREFINKQKQLQQHLAQGYHLLRSYAQYELAVKAMLIEKNLAYENRIQLLGKTINQTAAVIQWMQQQQHSYIAYLGKVEEHIFLVRKATNNSVSINNLEQIIITFKDIKTHLHALQSLSKTVKERPYYQEIYNLCQDAKKQICSGIEQELAKIKKTLEQKKQPLPYLLAMNLDIITRYYCYHLAPYKT
ncbi:MAG: hypothetical protein QW594_02890 [Candidatus Woesearchaeota archaeon]